MNDEKQVNQCQASRCCKAACAWILQILVWVAFPYLIFFVMYFRELRKYTVDTPSQKGNIFDALAVIALMIYIAYLIVMFTSDTYKYLTNKKESSTMYDKMGQLFKTPPVIKFSAGCYHNERRRSGKDTETVRVFTHRENMELPYYSAKDVSGLFLLDIDKASIKKKAYIKLILKTEVNFADAISYMDYSVQKDAFWRRNRYRDRHMEFTEIREVPGLEEYSLIQISEYMPTSISTSMFKVFTFIPFCQFYKIYLNSFCVTQTFKIRKVISTRYNLLDPQYNQQYQQITPALNINDQMYGYNAADTGYCNVNANVNIPTTEELQQAQQYSSQVPNYGITSVGGEINGIQVGVVQDIPQFNEQNYNIPPPSCADIGGDVALPDEQINQTGNNGGNVTEIPAQMVPMLNDLQAYPMGQIV